MWTKLVLALCAMVLFGAPCSVCAQYFDFGESDPVTVTLINGSYEMTYVVKDNAITFTLTANGQFWLGIGWHEAGSSNTEMTQADFVIAIFDDNGNLQSCQDYFASPNDGGFTFPVLDTSMGGYDNVYACSGKQTSAQTQVSFSRLLVTNDTTADHPLVNATQNLIFAHGLSNPLGKHKNNYGDFDINFLAYTGDHGNGSHPTVPPLPPPPSPSDELRLDFRKWHGVLNSLAFGFLMTFGMFVARYMKEHWWWFPVHITVQVTAILMALAALGMALWMVDGDHFSNVHSFVGISVIGSSVLAALLGWLADKMYDPARSRIPFFPDMVHWWIARLTIVASYVAIFMGMVLYGVDDTIMYGYAGFLGLFVSIFLVIEGCALRKKEEPLAHGHEIEGLLAR